MKKYFKLLRIKHYIKNLLVFLPLFFSGQIFNTSKLINATLGFVAFCLVSSAVYILNDYKDVEKDRKHPKKKNRPLASGEIKPSVALAIMVVCILIAVAISIYLRSILGAICLLLYLVLNIGYSLGLKKFPIVDIVILASGFVIRVFYGGFITDITISKWLYLVITTGSLYMGLGKRRNELSTSSDTREVLKHYNKDFLDKNMYVCVALANVFYALWTFELPNNKIPWTIPIFIILLMCYSLDVEGDSDGDPVEVILKDKKLIIIGLIYVVSLFLLLYL